MHYDARMTVIATLRATDIQWSEEGYVTVYELVGGQSVGQIVEFTEVAPDVSKLGKLFTLTLDAAETPTTVPHKVPQHVPMRVPTPTPQARPGMTPTFTPYFVPNQVPQATPQINQYVPALAPSQAPYQVPQSYNVPAPMQVAVPNLAPGWHHRRRSRCSTPSRRR